jgi:hypothetical protein
MLFRKEVHIEIPTDDADYFGADKSLYIVIQRTLKMQDSYVLAYAFTSYEKALEFYHRQLKEIAHFLAHIDTQPLHYEVSVAHSDRRILKTIELKNF